MTKSLSSRQPHSHYGSFAHLAFHLNFPAMQIDTALYDHQTETRAWTVIDVMRAMKGIEEPLAVGFWNSNALVADGANNFCADGRDFELHRTSGVRILYGVREQIGENVSQQTLVGLYLGRRCGERQFDRTSSASCRQDLVHELLQEFPQYHRRRLKFHLALIEASDEERFLHDRSHAARIVADGLQMIFAFGRLQLLQVVFQNFRG
jgi:hypothetical protein